MKELESEPTLIQIPTSCFSTVACGFSMVGDPRLWTPLEHSQVSSISLNHFEALREKLSFGGQHA